MPEHADAAADPLTNTVIPQPHLNCLTCLIHGSLSLLFCICHSAYMINCNFVLAESETVPWDAVTWYIIWISAKFDSVSTMQREDDEEISAVCYATPALDGLAVPHTPGTSMCSTSTCGCRTTIQMARSCSGPRSQSHSCVPLPPGNPSPMFNLHAGKIHFTACNEIRLA